MSDVKARRGLVSFSIKMDESLNPTETRAQGKLFGEIILKPRLVAEQIILPFSIVGQDFVI